MLIVIVLLVVAVLELLCFVWLNLCYLTLDILSSSVPLCSVLCSILHSPYSSVALHCAALSQGMFLCDALPLCAPCGAPTCNTSHCGAV